MNNLNITYQRKCRLELQEIIDTFSLKDSFRKIYKLRQEVTHYNQAIGRAARIHRIYIDNSLKVKNVSHLESTLSFTNNKAIFMEINNSNNNTDKKYSDHWKFNASLLKDEDFNKAIRNTISLYTNPVPTENVRENWDKLKISIKTVSIIKSKEINKKEEIEKKKL